MSYQNKLNLLVSRIEIVNIVKRLAGEIQRDYHDKHPVLVGVLKGSFVFLSDLVRSLDMPLEIEFVQASSYGKNRESSGRVRIMPGLRHTIKNRHVIIVEDIIDTGLTTIQVYDYLKKKQPASLKLCALLDKPSRRLAPVGIDYLGITVPDKFIVGYGVDFGEQFRNLPDIYTLEDEDI